MRKKLNQFVEKLRMKSRHPMPGLKVIIIKNLDSNTDILYRYVHFWINK